MIYTSENNNTINGQVTITTWDLGTGRTKTTVNGTVTVDRAMTSQEITFWQAHTSAEFGTTDALMQGLMNSFATAQDPATAPPWKQPTGAHDAYLPGAIVTYNSKTWRNDLPSSNVWAPGIQGAQWFDLTPPVSGPKPWVQPTGAQDAYNVGDHVTHNGHTWVSDAAANVWEPGVYGWSQVS